MNKVRLQVIEQISSLIGPISWMAGGTIISQLAPLIAAPILTRVYNPESYGEFAIFFAAFAVMGSVSTLRYEFAIPQPSSDAQARLLMGICVAVSIVVSAITFFPLIASSFLQFLDLLDKEVDSFFWMLPFAVFFYGSYQTLSLWETRFTRFDRVAKARVLQSFSMVIVQIAMGYLGAGGEGLVGGLLAGQLLSIAYLVSFSRKTIFQLREPFWGKRFRATLLRYRKMPIFSAPATLVDSLSLQLPVLFVAAQFDVAVAGLIAFSLRVLNAPLQVVAGAISQVLLQRISLLTLNSRVEVFRLISTTFFLLAFTVCPIVLVIFFFGMEIFSIAFGKNWEQAGQVASVLVFATGARFIASPLSSVLLMEANVKIGASWQFFYFVTLTTTLFFFSGQPLEIFLVAFVIHEVVQYCLYLGLIFGSVMVKRDV